MFGERSLLGLRLHSVLCTPVSTLADLQRMAADIDAKRAAGQPTVPSLLGDERKCNPFLRPSEQLLFTGAV